jgi:acyl-CoA synthetase (AMP-forming)/AMP-acid ligase II/acyl carrier protein
VTINELLHAGAVDRGRSIALEDVDRSGMSFERLDDLTRQVAAQLAASGVRRTHRVAIVLPNGPAMATSLLGVMRVATAAPLNPGLTRSEHAFYLRDLDARLLVVAERDRSEASAAAAELGVPVVTVVTGAAGEISLSWPGGSEVSSWGDAESDDPEATATDIALVLHTSGTTAKPKIVPLSHENLCRSAHNVAASLELRSADRCMNVMPLFHIHGLVASVLASLSAGSSVVCTPGFEAARFFDWFETARPSWYSAVPTMHQAILARADTSRCEMVARSDLRLVRSSSASLPPSVSTQIEERFGVPVIEAYGMTEAAHQMASNPLPPQERKPGSVGRAAGPEIAIADADGRMLAPTEIGEVVIRGSNVMSGYDGVANRSAHFFGDGWFRTGDQGYLDADGYLFLTGRLKEIINRGGETIAPRAIDEALLEHPDVAQAVAFAVPDPTLGEEVAAAVVVTGGVTEVDLQDFLSDRLSWARLPKRIILLDEIPKGATGKVQRIGLAAQLGVSSVRRPADAAIVDADDQASSATVEQVAALWREVLELDEVSLDAAFLEAGGDSVSAVSLALRVEAEFAVDLPLMAFFDAPTVRRQAALVDELRATGS